MQPQLGYGELAKRVVTVAQKHGVMYVSLIPPPEGGMTDQEGRMHLLLNLDGNTGSPPDFEKLAAELEQSCGCPVELYTLESIRHSPYGKDVIRQSIMLMPEN